MTSPFVTEEACRDIYENHIVPLYQRRCVQEIGKDYAKLFVHILMTKVPSDMKSEFISKSVFKNQEEQFQFCEKIVKKIEEYFKSKEEEPTSQDIDQAVVYLMVALSKNYRLENAGLLNVLVKCNMCINQLVKLPSNLDYL